MNEMERFTSSCFADGNPQEISNCSIQQETVIHGDSIHIAWACASILAKVYRDRIMRENIIVFISSLIF